MKKQWCSCTLTKDHEDLRADPYCKKCGGTGMIKKS